MPLIFPSGWVRFVAAAALSLVVACSDNDPIQPIPRAAIWPQGDLIDVAAPVHDHVLILSASGQIYFSRDAGTSFHVAHIPASGPLRSLSMGSQEVGWAVGPGTLLRTDDGGAHWRRLRGPRRAAELNLLRVAALGEARAIVIGVGGLLLRTQDGGVIWQDVSEVQEVSGETPAEWTALACLTGAANRCWVAGEEMHASSDGGQTWQSIERGDTVPMPNISFGFGQTDLSDSDIEKIREAYALRPSGVEIDWQIDSQVSVGEIERIAEDGDPHALFELIDARGEELRLVLEELGVPEDRIERRGAPPWGYEEFLDDDPDLLDRYWASRRGEGSGARIQSREALALSAIILDPVRGGVGVGINGRGFESVADTELWEPFATPTSHDLLDAARSGDRVVAVGRQGGLWIRDDATRAWRRFQPLGSDAFFDALRGVAFDPRGEKGYIVGDHALLFVTHDAGETWSTLRGARDGESISSAAPLAQADRAVFR
jgi:photosystem II stability/assembly factor-like uncharacterized protein